MLARSFACFPSFFSQILDFIYRPVLIFISIYFKCRETENLENDVHNRTLLKLVKLDRNVERNNLSKAREAIRLFRLSNWSLSLFVHAFITSATEASAVFLSRFTLQDV